MKIKFRNAIITNDNMRQSVENGKLQSVSGGHREAVETKIDASDIFHLGQDFRREFLDLVASCRQTIDIGQPDVGEFGCGRWKSDESVEGESERGEAAETN